MEIGNMKHDALINQNLKEKGSLIYRGMKILKHSQTHNLSPYLNYIYMVLVPRVSVVY